MQRRLSFWKKECCIHKEVTTKLVHGLCTAAMKLANKRPWLTYRDLTVADRSASFLKEHHRFISFDRGIIMELATASRCRNLYWGHGKMEGEDDTTLSFPTTRTTFWTKSKSQNVNRMASRLERLGEMRRWSTVLPTGLKPRLTASEDHNSDPPFWNNLFPHS